MVLCNLVMLKKLLLFVVCLICLVPAQAKRKQWTEKQAWAWYERVGVVKGFNDPIPAYPGQSRKTILKKAVELGFNSVRFWVPAGTVEERVECIREMIKDAEEFDLTVQPVLHDISYIVFDRDMKEVEKELRAVVRPFIKEKRILFWDVFNEPSTSHRPITYQRMDFVEKMVGWFRDENVSQPITASLFWHDLNLKGKAMPRITEVEAMMDIHNIHFYNCARDEGQRAYAMLDYVKSISDRPIIATECLARNNGSGVQRSLPIFAKYRMGFYIWGLYSGERNWEPRWTRSAYDPYMPMFHNVTYSDGDVIDPREIELIRNYRFAESGENLDQGIEYTDRWNDTRAWRWMVTGQLVGANSSFVPGYSIQDKKAAQGEACNAMRVKLDFNEWKADSKTFIERVDKMLYAAEDCGVTIIPVLLDDNDAHNDAQELANYVGAVVHRFYCDTRIKAWDLYDRPGATVTDKKRISELVTLIFKRARTAFANQPLTMTPVVSVKPFEEGFNPWKALEHGRRAGWNRFEYSGGSDYELVYKIWCLSDVTSFYTEMPAAESRWLMAMCYRFGRPIFCSSWDVEKSGNVAAQLKNFSDFQVYWFAKDRLPAEACGFKFNQISTQKQY